MLYQCEVVYRVVLHFTVYTVISLNYDEQNNAPRFHIVCCVCVCIYNTISKGNYRMQMLLTAISGETKKPRPTLFHDNLKNLVLGICCYASVDLWAVPLRSGS